MISFVLFTCFAVWVIFFDGADTLEGTVASAFLVDFMAPFLTARLLRAYVAFMWIAMLATLAINHFSKT